MEAESIDYLITQEEPFVERLTEGPVSTLVQEATQAVHNAAERINNFAGINEAHDFDNHHWFGYVAVAGIVALAVYGLKKAIDNYRSTDKYFIKSMGKAYDKKASARGNKQLRRRAPRFKRNMELLFSHFDRGYQNKALRMVIEGVMQSDNPYDTIRNVRDELKPGMTGSEIVSKASKHIPNGAEVKAKYDAQYGSEEALVRVLRAPA